MGEHNSPRKIPLKNLSRILILLVNQSLAGCFHCVVSESRYCDVMSMHVTEQ